MPLSQGDGMRYDTAARVSEWVTLGRVTAGY